MSSRRLRARGAFLFEAIVACGFAVVVIGLAVDEVLRQRLELSFAREQACARSALLSTCDRLRAGELAAPPPGRHVSVPADEPGLGIALERAAAPLDPRLSSDGLVPVVVRVSWRSADGKPNARELTTLVAGGDR